MSTSAGIGSASTLTGESALIVSSAASSPCGSTPEFKSIKASFASTSSRFARCSAYQFEMRRRTIGLGSSLKALIDDSSTRPAVGSNEAEPETMKFSFRSDSNFVKLGLSTIYFIRLV